MSRFTVPNKIKHNYQTPYIDEKLLHLVIFIILPEKIQKNKNSDMNEIKLSGEIDFFLYFVV